MSARGPARLHPMVLITGQMRSGGAAVAEIVHRLGVPVATVMHAPVGPHYRPDWEDARLVEAMAPLARGRVMRDPRGFLSAHWRDRTIEAGVVFRAHRIAAKGPLLALAWNDVLDTAGAFGPPIVIETVRPQTEIDGSIERNCVPEVRALMHAANARIVRTLIHAPPPVLIVSHRHLTDDPLGETGLIAEAIGVTDRDLIERAAQSVKEPTCLPS